MHLGLARASRACSLMYMPYKCLSLYGVLIRDPLKVSRNSEGMAGATGSFHEATRLIDIRDRSRKVFQRRRRYLRLAARSAGLLAASRRFKSQLKRIAVAICSRICYFTPDVRKFDLELSGRDQLISEISKTGSWVAVPAIDLPRLRSERADRKGKKATPVTSIRISAIYLASGNRTINASDIPTRRPSLRGKR